MFEQLILHPQSTIDWNGETDALKIPESDEIAVLIPIT